MFLALLLPLAVLLIGLSCVWKSSFSWLLALAGTILGGFAVLLVLVAS
jgi:hypothetical protein